MKREEWGENRTEQNRTEGGEENRTEGGEENRTEQNRTEQNRTEWGEEMSRICLNRRQMSLPAN